MCSSSGLSLLQVSRMREEFEKQRFIDDGVGLSIFDAMSMSSVREVLLLDRVVELAREVLGPKLYLFPNVTVRRNSQTAWHVDEAFRKGDLELEESRQSSFLQVTVYFQENNLKFGGGLDVVSGSHNLTGFVKNARSIGSVIDRCRKRAKSIFSKAGDIVCWHGALLHRSTPWRSIPNVPNFAIHWTVASAGANHTKFFWHLVDRGRNSGDITGVDRRYNAMERFVFEKNTPGEFVKKSHSAGIRLVDVRRIGQLDRYE